MEANEVLPDHLRCNRTDGRKWRCRRRVKENKKLCELHYIQGKHRQNKETVPASLKLIRMPGKGKNRDHGSELPNGKIRAGKRGKILKAVNAVKKSGAVVDVSDALDDALKKMKLKRGNLQLELIRLFLKRQLEKRKEAELGKNSKGKGEVVKHLPYGKMAISPACTDFFGNVGSVDIKLGIDSSPFPRRCFRSKNIEPLPIGSLQMVPYARNLAKLKKGKSKKCHWCRRSSYRTLIKCSKCRKEHFCLDCIEERYCDKQEIITACAVCRKTCSCRTCSRKPSKDKDVEHVDPRRNKKTIDKIHLLHYLVFKLLPAVQHINQEQNVEIEIEAHIKGKSPSDIQVQSVELSSNKLHCCSNCKFSVGNFHRRCTTCSYNLCLNCCWEFCRREMPAKLEEIISKYPKRRKAYIPGTSNLPSKTKKISTYKHTDGSKHLVSPTFLNWKSCNDGSISCPPVAFGGCGIGLLDLRCVFPFTWTKELEASAGEIVCRSKFPDATSCCRLCNTSENKAGQNKYLQEVATREDSSDNFLYYPTMQELHGEEEDLQHFQSHWCKGHPVIVQNVLTASDLSWDPVAMFCTYLEKSSTRSQCDKEALKATNCLDWCEVEIGSKHTFIGSFEGRRHARFDRCEMLKLRSWLSSHLFKEQFPAHYAEIIRSLPLQKYMNPESGLLNLAIKAPPETTNPYMGPCIYISYGGPEDLMQADFLTKLCYDSNDVVNILAHATDVPISTEQISKIKQLMKGDTARDHRESTKRTTDQKSGDMEENPSWHNESIEGLNFPCVANKDKSMPHAMEDHLEFDSDVSIFGFRSIPSSEETDSQDDGASCFRKKLLSESCGAQWDIFRREDVPKLLEYLRQHSSEFSDSYLFEKHVIHPILDQSFFLDTAHKMRLKQEFNIEPWTFKQHTGEAVIIPAGCPYQIRKFKSCVNIVLDFVSPENAAECINLIDDQRLLPLHHKAKGKRFEVKEMTLYTVNDSIKEIQNLMQTVRMTDTEFMDRG